MYWSAVLTFVCFIISFVNDPNISSSLSGLANSTFLILQPVNAHY